MKQYSRIVARSVWSCVNCPGCGGIYTGSKRREITILVSLILPLQKKCRLKKKGYSKRRLKKEQIRQRNELARERKKQERLEHNEDEQFASIYTHNSSLKRRLSKFSKQYPEICRPGKENSEGSVSYVIDKSRLPGQSAPSGNCMSKGQFAEKQ